MRELIEQYELIKEIHYQFDNLEPTIKARIYKIIKGANANYTWTINFYCRLEGEAMVYTPSAPFGDSVDEVEIKLNRYVERFKNAVAWIEDEDF